MEPSKIEEYVPVSCKSLPMRRPSFPVRAQSLDATIKACSLRPNRHQINIRTRIDHQRNAQRRGHLANLSNLLYLQTKLNLRILALAGYVFKVQTDGPGVHECL